MSYIAHLPWGPVEMQVNFVELHLCSVEIYFRLIEKQVRAYKI